MSITQAPDSARTLTLAVHQHIPTPCDISRSLARITEHAAQAAAQGVQMLVVPEASLTGYNISLSKAKEVAVEREGTTTERLQTLCQSSNLALTYGFIERQGQHLYNTVQVIDASGDIVAHYRKTHLWGNLDESLFEAGDTLSPIISINDWHIGLLICYDIEFPESARTLSLQGADVLLTPTALMSPWTFVAEQMVRVRAAENQLFIAYANYCGKENDLDYVGCSCIVGPDGNDIARAEQTEMLLVATLDKQAISDIRSVLPYHPDRRPEIYAI